MTPGCGLAAGKVTPAWEPRELEKLKTELRSDRAAAREPLASPKPATLGASGLMNPWGWDRGARDRGARDRGARERGAPREGTEAPRSFPTRCANASFLPGCSWHWSQYFIVAAVFFEILLKALSSCAWPPFMVGPTPQDIKHVGERSPWGSPQGWAHPAQTLPVGAFSKFAYILIKWICQSTTAVHYGNAKSQIKSVTRWILTGVRVDSSSQTDRKSQNIWILINTAKERSDKNSLFSGMSWN